MLQSGEARERREQHGIRLSEAARACGVSPSAVLRWERGQWSPRYEHAVRYARVLDELAG